MSERLYILVRMAAIICRVALVHLKIRLNGKGTYDEGTHAE
jgi:hypothetical protein